VRPERRVGGDPDTARVDKHFVYHPDYVDSVVMRYWDSDQSGGPDTEHYYLQDANYNVTALTDDAGAVVERYAYTPYGEVAHLNPNFSEKTTQTSDVDNEYLYTGKVLWPEGSGQFLSIHN